MTSGPGLVRIKQIIEDVDNRCLAADGPVTLTRDEITGGELQEIRATGSRRVKEIIDSCPGGRVTTEALQQIYALACGKPESWRPK